MFSCSTANFLGKKFVIRNQFLFQDMELGFLVGCFWLTSETDSRGFNPDMGNRLTWEKLMARRV